MTTRFRADHQLSVRMLLVVVLLGLAYAAFTSILGVLIGSLLVSVLIMGALLAAQVWFCDRLALCAMRARIVTPEEAPRLTAMVDRVCAAASMPPPRVAVADLPLPNAFAIGRPADRAVLCVTTGLLARLDTEELEGVLAHELSHIAHRDTAVITLTSFLGVLAGLVERFALSSGLVGGRVHPDTRGRTYLPVILAMAASHALCAMGYLPIRVLSQHRELAADRASAVLTGRPFALASALTKLVGGMQRVPRRDLRAARPFNAFFFTPVLVSGVCGATLISTHPSLERRLSQLAELSIELGDSA